ncbi:hypothetical protein [Kitasatospora sp. NPDC093806]
MTTNASDAAATEWEVGPADFLCGRGHGECGGPGDQAPEQRAARRPA